MSLRTQGILSSSRRAPRRTASSAAMSAYQPLSARATLLLGAAEAAMAVVLLVVTNQSLFSDGQCLLNESGNVCDFVYCTCGFSLLFTLQLCGPILFQQWRTGKAMAKPLILEASHLSLFGAFWWMVLAITITQRGKQAAAAGLGGGSARDATMAFAWLEMVLFLANSAAVVVDRHKYRKARGKEDDEDASSEPSSNASERYVYTRALPRTPVS